MAETAVRPAAPIQGRAQRTNVAMDHHFGHPFDGGALLSARRRKRSLTGGSGARAGAFVLKPSIEVSEGFDDNPLRTQGGPGSRFATLKSASSAQSNWSRHELSGPLLRGSFNVADVDHNDRPDAAAIVRGRIYVTKTDADRAREKSGADDAKRRHADSVTGAKRPPNIYTLGSTVGVAYGFEPSSGLYGGDQRNIIRTPTRWRPRPLRQQLQHQSARLRASYEATGGR